MCLFKAIEMSVILPQFHNKITFCYLCDYLLHFYLKFAHYFFSSLVGLLLQYFLMCPPKVIEPPKDLPQPKQACDNLICSLISVLC